MKIFPAIDILDGKAVRLYQGRLDAVKVYNDDPVDQARIWADQGAEWLHVVDLDGAVLGKAGQRRGHRARSSRPSTCRFRPVAASEPWRRSSASSTAASRAWFSERRLSRNPNWSRMRVRRFDGIVAGIDARDGKVAIEGWKQGTEHGVLELDSRAGVARRAVVSPTRISRRTAPKRASTTAHTARWWTRSTSR